MTKKIRIPDFTPRDYQLPFLEAMDSGIKRAVLVWHRRCIAENSKILMADGSWKFIQDIVPGDSVISWNGAGLESDTVLKVYSNGERTCRRHCAYGAESPTMTKDHRVLCSHSGINPKWKAVGDLNLSDSCFTYSSLPPDADSFPRLARFLGYMISDGYCNVDQQPKYTTNSELLKRDFISLTKELFPTIQIRERAKGNGWDIGLSKGESGNRIPHPARELLTAHGLWSRKRDKRIPKAIWSADLETVGEFLSAVVEADGSIYCQKTGGMATTYIPAKAEVKISVGESELLAWDYYYLLKKIGIQAGAVYNERGWCWTVRIWEAASVIRLLRLLTLNEKREKKEAALSLKMHQRPHHVHFDRLKMSRLNVVGSITCKVYDLEVEKNKSFVSDGYIVHNSGKEVTCWNYMIREAVCGRVGTYCYFFPTSSLGRRILWKGATKDGRRFIDFIPPELIVGKPNAQDMSIELFNGSIIQIIGTEKIINVGVNPIGCVFSEFSLQHPRTWDFVRPILKENEGWAIFNLTPRGKNAAYELYLMAKRNKDWFCEKLTIEDTGILTEKDMDEERAEGMSEDLIQQEYYCSFTQGIEGSFYAKHLAKADADGRITNVPYDPYTKVDTYWDLGVHDSTAILFVQDVGQEVHIIDTYSNMGEGLDHYARVIENKARDGMWQYGEHHAPHDIQVRELGHGAKTRLQMAQDLGLRFSIVPNLSIHEGIEMVRAMWHKLWIDRGKSVYFLKCVENYHRTYNERLNVYSDKPCHDWSSDFCDSLRYLAIMQSKSRSGRMTEEQANKLEKMYVPRY